MIGRFVSCARLALFASLLTFLPIAAPAVAQSDVVTLATEGKVWTGDLDEMLKRRTIRVLVPYSKTLYFLDVNGNQRGISYDLMREFEDALNKKRKTGNLRINIVFVPVGRDQLIPALLDGRGDVVAANLTITPDRLAQVDFTTPLATGIKEVIVTGPGAPELKTLDDLAGKTVFVRPSTSFYESFTAQNEKFKERNLPLIDLVPAPGVFEAEDGLEMVNAGLVKIIATDLYLGRFWKQVFPNITVHEDISLRDDGEIAFAIRKNSPQLKAELDPFIEKNRVGTAIGNTLLKRYLKSVKWVKNAISDEERKKFSNLIELFTKYGEKYNIDWLLMAAQGYQESRLDQSTKSHVGAIGVMQVMPDTGKELGVGDINEVEANIHAGVKYIRYMIDHYYAEEPMDAENKVLFAFAAYNAGPGRVRSLRKEATKRGLDPNLWFNNVELVAADKVGRETVQYVRNIYKYYVAYKLVTDQRRQRKEATTTTP